MLIVNTHLTPAVFMLNMGPIILGLFLAVAGLLVVSSLLRFNIQQKKLWRSYAAEFFILAWILMPSLLGPYYFLIMLLIMGLVISREFLQLNTNYPKADWFWLAASGTSLLLGLVLGLPALALLLVATTILLVYSLLRHGTQQFVSRSTNLIFGLVYLWGPLACLWQIYQMPYGWLWVILLFFITELNDSFALVWGAVLGRRKLAPTISPNKTIGGTVGGALTTVLVMTAIAIKLKLGLGYAELARVLLLIPTGIAGDLIASKIKRYYGVKDFSNLVPSQGGLLDIYDSFLFVVPLFYLILAS
ncbi:MAG: phosphatidate cytidylyltransferase [Gammaproteobacteria bacterium]|jgi:CDP-diglyceride synthetase|nr:phosphatidate cytidylyltransferase [Gammaproteobacteria bacterium]